MASTTETTCVLGHTSPVQECPKCNPLSEASTSPVRPEAPSNVWGPAQLPPPAPPTVPLEVEDLDAFISNLRDQGVRRLAYTGNIKGAAVVLEVQFEPRPRPLDDGGIE